MVLQPTQGDQLSQRALRYACQIGPDHLDQRVPARLVTLVQDIEEQRDVHGEHLQIMQLLALHLPGPREEVVNARDGGNTVDEVAGLATALGDRLVGGLPLTPEVDRFEEHVHRRREEVRRNRQRDVLAGSR